MDHNNNNYENIEKEKGGKKEKETNETDVLRKL